MGIITLLRPSSNPINPLKQPTKYELQWMNSARMKGRFSIRRCHVNDCWNFFSYLRMNCPSARKNRFSGTWYYKLSKWYSWYGILFILLIFTISWKKGNGLRSYRTYVHLRMLWRVVGCFIELRKEILWNHWISSRKEDGMIKKTFGVAHYSWWRSYCFDVNKAKVMMLWLICF